MSCLTAEAHINIILLCPPRLMTQDMVHLISCQQMAGSLIVPIYPPMSIPSRSRYQCSRQQTGMRRCGWSQVKELGGAGEGRFTKGLVLKSIRSFSRTNPSWGERNTPLFIQVVPKGVTKSSGPFWICAILPLSARKEEVGKPNSEAKARQPH